MEEEMMEKKKEFTFRGKSIDELKTLDIREFAKFLASRERRTIIRNTQVIEKFLKKCRRLNAKNKNIRTHERNIIIVPEMVGMTVHVHKGNGFEAVRIVPEMIGHRLGEFALTRKPVKHGAAGIGATKSSASRSVK